MSNVLANVWLALSWLLKVGHQQDCCWFQSPKPALSTYFWTCWCGLAACRSVGNLARIDYIEWRSVVRSARRAVNTGRGVSSPEKLWRAEHSGPFARRATEPRILNAKTAPNFFWIFGLHQAYVHNSFPKLILFISFVSNILNKHSLAQITHCLFLTVKLEFSPKKFSI